MHTDQFHQPMGRPPDFIQCSSTKDTCADDHHLMADPTSGIWASLNSPKHLEILALMGITQPEDSWER